VRLLIFGVMSMDAEKNSTADEKRALGHPLRMLVQFLARAAARSFAQQSKVAELVGFGDLLGSRSTRDPISVPMTAAETSGGTGRPQDD
jgi:hypothetical protein